MQAYEQFKLMRENVVNYGKKGQIEYLPINNCMIDYITMFGEKNDITIACHARKKLPVDRTYILFYKLEANDPYARLFEIDIYRNILTKNVNFGWPQQLLSGTIRKICMHSNR